MELTCRATEEDDPILTDLADALAERAVLWCNDTEDLPVQNAIRAYSIAAAVIAADDTIGRTQ